MKAIALAPKSGCVKATASGLLVALPRGLQTATLSNCGDILKLQSAKPVLETGRWPGRETLGTATTSADETMDDPQPSPNGRPSPNGCCSQTKWQWVLFGASLALVTKLGSIRLGKRFIMHSIKSPPWLVSNQALVSLRKASWRVVAHADSILAAWACHRALAAVSVIVLALRLDDGVVQLETPAYNRYDG